MDHDNRIDNSGMERARRLIAEEREKRTGFLDLGNLELTELPAELFELTHLHSLNLGLGYFDKLGQFHVSVNGGIYEQNQFQKLPNELGALRNLAALWLGWSPIRDLGPLAQLTGLQSLDCLGTQVSDLAPLAGLSGMRRLVVEGCQLCDMPRRLLFGKVIVHLGLHGTTIPGIPAEVLSPNSYSSCLEQLRDHFLDLESTGAEEIREAKLVVLGNGRVGKTQICRILRGLKYDDSVNSTHGITVTS